MLGAKNSDFASDTVLWSPAVNAGEKVCWRCDVFTDVVAFWMGSSGLFFCQFFG